MERNDAIAAVIAGTGILAATIIAGLAVVRLAAPESTRLDDSGTAVRQVILPELPPPPSQVPQLSTLPGDSGTSPGPAPEDAQSLPADVAPTPSGVPGKTEAEDGRQDPEANDDDNDHGETHESEEHDNDDD